MCFRKKIDDSRGSLNFLLDRYEIREVPNDCGKNEAMRLSKVIAHRKNY